MICQKCNGTNFDDWTYKGARFKTCLNCYQVYQIAQSAEFDAHLEETRLEREQSKKQTTVTCPYCKSTNTKKISGTSRFVSTGLFGLASSKIGKQWHCNSCKSDF